MFTGRTARNIHWATSALIVLGLLTGLPGKAGAAPKTVDRAVEAASKGNAPFAALVRVAPDALDAVAAAVETRGTKVDARLPGILVVTVHPNKVDDLLAIPGVLGLSSNALVISSGASKKASATLTTTKTTSGSSTTSATWSFADLEASWQQWDSLFGALGLKWSPYKGAGVGVAVVDSGIDGSLSDFSGRITAFYDFTNGGRKAEPTDEYGHGTHVAGLIGASSGTFGGLAPKVAFVGVRVLDANGQGRTSDVIAALDFLARNHAHLGVQVINLSLGHPILEPAATDPLVQAVERAVASGLVVVTSAGNIGKNPLTGEPGYAGITSPGNAPSAITAGSLDLHGTADRSDDTVSPFSSRGPTWYDGLVKPDLVAPGHGLFASSATGSTLAQDGTLSPSGADVKMFGTSMAAATTTGVVALLLEANRAAFPQAGHDLTPNAVKALLQFTAIRVSAAGAEADVLTAGAGGLNALGAITLARHVDPGAAAGAWWLTAGVPESTNLAGTTWSWTRRIIWGATPLYGDAVYANLAAWQPAVVWGSTLVWGDTLIWGENVVMSTTLIWGEALVWGDGLVTLDGQSLIWGDTLIWGEALIWGDALVWGASAPAP